MTVYVAVVHQSNGGHWIAGVAASGAEAAAMAAAAAGKPMTLSSRYWRWELEDENGDLVGHVLETVVGKGIENQN